MANYVSTKAYSGKGAIFYFNLLGSSPPAFANSIPEIRLQKPSGQQMKSDDATNLSSPAEEFVNTIRTSGTWDITSNMIPTDPGYIAMEALFYTSGPYTVQGMVQFPKAPGQNTIGDQRWFLFFVEKFMPGNIEPSKLIQLDISLKITGDVTTVAGS